MLKNGSLGRRFDFDLNCLSQSDDELDWIWPSHSECLCFGSSVQIEQIGGGVIEISGKISHCARVREV